MKTWSPAKSAIKGDWFFGRWSLFERFRPLGTCHCRVYLFISLLLSSLSSLSSFPSLLLKYWVKTFALSTLHYAFTTMFEPENTPKKWGPVTTPSKLWLKVKFSSFQLISLVVFFSVCLFVWSSRKKTKQKNTGAKLYYKWT